MIMYCLLFIRPLDQYIIAACGHGIKMYIKTFSKTAIFLQINTNLLYLIETRLYNKALYLLFWHLRLKILHFAVVTHPQNHPLNLDAIWY